MTWAEYHSESERFASNAELMIRTGNADQAVESYRSAAEAETKALSALSPEKKRTIAITAVSAVALWYKSHEYSTALQIAHTSLAKWTLPEFAVCQLNNLIQLIWSAQAAEESGIKFVQGDVLVSVKGGEIVHGGAPLDLIIDKIGEIKSVYYRVIEMLLEYPLRKRGMPQSTVQEWFRPWLFQAPAGSYQFAVKVQEPDQRELFPEARPTVEKVTSTFLSILRATTTDPINGLPVIVPNKEYRTAFLKLARNIAPTGVSFTQIEIKDASIPEAEPIAMDTEIRDLIKSAIKMERPPVKSEEAEKIERLRGILRGVHLDEDWLEISLAETPDHPHTKIYKVGETLDDVIGPMVNKHVIVTAITVRNKYTYLDIELE